jgi:hypothetical protein
MLFFIYEMVEGRDNSSTLTENHVCCLSVRILWLKFRCTFDDLNQDGVRLEAGGWRLEAGGWRLEAGGWRLEAGGVFPFHPL